MPLPRNIAARNKKTHQTIISKKQPERKETELNNICQKHKIGDLTFRSCKLADAEGKITYVDHENIKGNLRTGIMLVKATKIEPAVDAIYDLVQIARD